MNDEIYLNPATPALRPAWHGSDKHDVLLFCLMRQNFGGNFRRAPESRSVHFRFFDLLVEFGNGRYITFFECRLPKL